MDLEELFDYGVKRLAARAHSTGELRDKLRRKAACRDDVEAVLARLAESAYLDDAKFAEAFASARLESRAQGARRVLRDLRGRRVAPSVAEGTVKRVFAGVDEEALIEDYLRRRLRTALPVAGGKALASAYGRLLRAGFAPGTSLRVLRKLAAEPELLDGFEPPEETAGEGP